MLSILQSSKRIKDLTLRWPRHRNRDIRKNHAWMRMEIKPLDVSIYCLHAMNCTLPQLLRCQRDVSVWSEHSQTDEEPAPADISAIQSKGWPAQTDVPHSCLHMGLWQRRSNSAYPDGFCSCLVCLNQTVVHKASHVDLDALDILPRHPCFPYLGSADTPKPTTMTTIYIYKQ